MFKYENDVCEYIRNKAEEHPNGLSDDIIDSILLEYLNNNKLVLINIKTLTSVKTIEEIEVNPDSRFYGDKYCMSVNCMGKSDIVCTTCYLDYKLSNGPYKFIKKEN